MDKQDLEIKTSCDFTNWISSNVKSRKYEEESGQPTRIIVKKFIFLLFNYSIC